MRFLISQLLQEPRGDALCDGLRTQGISLGGTFYDYLCRSDGSLAGVRYYIDDDTVIANHLVYEQFRADRRFSFRPGEFVDIVFKNSDAEALHLGQLSLLVVQDFGGECL
jgi:hypothetical protein